MSRVLSWVNFTPLGELFHAIVRFQRGCVKKFVVDVTVIRYRGRFCNNIVVDEWCIVYTILRG